jgi:hypothetical protein
LQNKKSPSEQSSGVFFNLKLCRESQCGGITQFEGSTKAIKIDDNDLRRNGEERLYYVRLLYRNNTEVNNAFGREFQKMNVDGNAAGDNDALTAISGYEVLFREKVSIPTGGTGESGVYIPAIQMVLRFSDRSRLEDVLDSGNLVMGQHKHIEKGILKFSTGNIYEATAGYLHDEITSIINGICEGNKEAFSFVDKVTAIPNYTGNQKYYTGLIIGPAEQIITLYEILLYDKNISRSDMIVRFE